MNLIEVKNVTKGFSDNLFRKKIILQNIDLTVKEGDFVVIQGLNGAGKSTLLKLILGLQEPDSGSIQLFGKSPKSSASKLQLGTVFQEVNPPNSLKVKELIELVRSYYPNAISTQKILETCGLTNQKDTFPIDLSGGQKQLLYFALALVGNPKLLVLDEPTKSLDVEGLSTFWQQIEECRAKGVTILIVSHIQSDKDKLKSLATHIVTVADGKLTYEKQPLETSISPNEKIANSSQFVNPLNILFQQTWAEILQLFRNWAVLASVLLFSTFLAVIPFVSGQKPDNSVQTLTIIAAFSLLIFGFERLGKQVAFERVEGWLKLLRVTPLPPSLYFAAKIIMTMIVLILSFSTIFVIGIFKFGVEQTLTQCVVLGSKLLLITLPFAILGIALGYVFSPKTVDSITALLIPVGILLSGLVPIKDPKFFQDIVVTSPFFHYGQILKFIAGIPDDGQLMLHLLWLAFYGVVAGLIAQFAYQRDRVSQ